MLQITVAKSNLNYIIIYAKKGDEGILKDTLIKNK